MIHTGDCIEVMAGMAECSVDAIVTDPPYLLRFMGKAWDAPTVMSGHSTPNPDVVGFYQAIGTGGGRHDGGLDNWQPNRMQTWHERWACEAFRVAKPGAHLLAFGGTRTYHRLVCAIEDAGWEIRDCLVWAYASGFPKSLNFPDGFGTALKPAWEPIVMARKPLAGTVAVNRERYGTGALNIDATRIGPVEAIWSHHGKSGFADGYQSGDAVKTEQGRWPANLILTDPIFDGDTPGVVGGGEAGPAGTAVNRNRLDGSGGYGGWARGDGADVTFADSGTYSRFFLIPKAARSDREPLIASLPERTAAATWGDIGPVEGNPRKPDNGHVTVRQNVHPTVKPLDLMRHLVRLVTPPRGTVLDPFLGSGTTALAAEMEGFEWIGIEREPEYVAIAEARLNGTQRGLGLEAS